MNKKEQRKKLPMCVIYLTFLGCDELLYSVYSLLYLFIKKTQVSYIFILYPLYLLILGVFGKSLPGFRRKNAQSTLLLPRYKFWRLLED